MSSPLMIVEPFIEAAALIAGLSWLFCTIHSTATTHHNLLRLTAASAGIAIVTVLVLEYARLNLLQQTPHFAIDLGSALLLLIVGIAWLRPAILLSSGLHLRPSSTSLAPPLEPHPPPDLSSNSLLRRRGGTWPLTGVTAGMLVAALNNADQPLRTSMPVSVVLLLVSWWLAICVAGSRVAATGSILRIIAGCLFAALGSFQISELLTLKWRHPASVLWALVAAYLVTTCWLIETCHDGEPKYLGPIQLDTVPSPSVGRIAARTRSRNVLLGVEVVLWTTALGLCLHFGWHQAIGMMDWQAGGMLFAGFILLLVHSIFVDVRLPGAG